MKKIVAITAVVAMFGGFGSASAGDVAAGKAKFAVCAGCHGPTGAGNLTAGYPALTGKTAEFVAQQLKLFKSGDRSNATMMAMTAPLSDTDIENVAAYIATLK